MRPPSWRMFDVRGAPNSTAPRNRLALYEAGFTLQPVKKIEAVGRFQRGKRAANPKCDRL